MEKESEKKISEIEGKRLVVFYFAKNIKNINRFYRNIKEIIFCSDHTQPVQ